MEEKNYLIIGASSDLGCGLIESLSEKVGSDSTINIVATYNNGQEKITSLERKIKNNNCKIYPIHCDLSDLGQVEELIKYVENTGINVQHIVSFAAGKYRYNRLAEWNSQRVITDINIQLNSLARICGALIPSMVDHHFGRIVVMLSSCTIGTPPSSLSEYTAVKYATLGLIKCLAAEYGDKGININGVSPAMVDTQFVSCIGRKMREISAESNPKHRNLIVGDVIPTIEFLLSNDSEFVNGQNFNLSGRI